MSSARHKSSFDIAPYALPNCAPGEIRFEQQHDIGMVVAHFSKDAPNRINLFYLRKVWPQQRIEEQSDLDNPCQFGWSAMDDWFNCEWQKAAIKVSRQGSKTVVITFNGLTAEFPEIKDYDVSFRRTLGLKLDIPEQAKAQNISVYTASGKTESKLRVELDAGKRTPGKTLSLYGYNAKVQRVAPIRGVSLRKDQVRLNPARKRSFAVTVQHMDPAHRYCNDEGHLTFVMDRDTFTISLASLAREGPVWFAEKGIFITEYEDPTGFAEYCESTKNSEKISKMVLKQPEQSFQGAYNGQPRPHAVHYNLGVKHNRQRFIVEPNGDIVLAKWNVSSVRGKDTDRFKNHGDARLFFGLEKWCAISRYADPAPILAYNIHMRQNGLTLEQNSFAVPLLSSILEGRSAGDESIIALVRFRFRNTGGRPATARLPINYSQDSSRSSQGYGTRKRGQDDSLVPVSDFETLSIADNRIMGNWNGEKVLRCTCRSTMRLIRHGKGVMLVRKLEPNESCEVILKVPFIALETSEEYEALRNLDFERCYRKVAEFWSKEVEGAKLHVPEPHLNELHAAHLTHVQITDLEMPDGSGLINTSVGTSTYGNFSNESCMIIQELDQRGLHEEARRRLGIWIKYQGTASQPGNFTDYEGMYFGAGGFEAGSYNQHHGWVLWCLCEHFLVAHDKKWFKSVAGSVIAGADWVFRQRRNTMTRLPHSRGWEYGFLPAGSLEDVTDFYYWLSTNALTWRGVDHAARALEVINHPEAERIRKESDRYRKDLVKGFEIMRQHSPLVRLRDGRWVPHYPSRIYSRGRDVGWIREVLEGSVYLLISSLYRSGSKQAQWILDDYQDNRYVKPPYGYVISDFESNWFNRGGFSIQPNLLAGLMPYLDRDEPELYIWMFFNAWCACYREEIGAMVEHPLPVLGYSNCAHFKTSDQANAIMWLRYMFVYWNNKMLHFGRAVPRAWLKNGNDIGVTKISTYYGEASVRYISEVANGRIILEAEVEHAQDVKKMLVRFRHPEKKRMRSVSVNGNRWSLFDPGKEDVEITGLKRKIVVEARY